MSQFTHVGQYWSAERREIWFLGARGVDLDSEGRTVELGEVGRDGE